MRNLMRRAKAFVMPGEEDFGITPVEAMACGTPVIALGCGGVLDSVIDGVTGSLIPQGDDESVIDSFAEKFTVFDRNSFDPATIRSHAEKFGRHEFRRNIARVVTQTIGGETLG